jgi:DNA mismatch repair ATPase MutS
MFLDSATLQDLEIVPMPRVRGTTLWSLIDRTRTRIGREMLRERLLALPHVTERWGRRRGEYRAPRLSAVR